MKNNTKFSKAKIKLYKIVMLLFIALLLMQFSITNADIENEEEIDQNEIENEIQQTQNEIIQT